MLIYIIFIGLIALATAQTTADPGCPMDGYFPSMVSCREYYICLNGTKTVHTCGNGFLSVYSPTTRSCVRRTFKNRCYRFNCIGLFPHYVKYLGDNSIYALCQRNRVLSIHKCAAGMEFNNRKQACHIQCAGERFIADPFDCASFYECVKIFGLNNYFAYTRSCPINSWFDPETLQCGNVNKCIDPHQTSTTEIPRTESSTLPTTLSPTPKVITTRTETTPSISTLPTTLSPTPEVITTTTESTPSISTLPTTLSPTPEVITTTTESTPSISTLSTTLSPTPSDLTTGPDVAPWPQI